LTTAQQNTSGRTRPTLPWRTDIGAVVAAAVCALVTWGSAMVADVELAVERGGEGREIGAGAVALVAGGSALLGLAVLRLLERWSPRALRVWTGLAVVVTLVSLLGPLAATTAAGTGTLLSLHGVVAAVVITSAHASRRHRHTAG
jgi:hypothetical protein